MMLVKASYGVVIDSWTTCTLLFLTDHGGQLTWLASGLLVLPIRPLL